MSSERLSPGTDTSDGGSAAETPRADGPIPIQLPPKVPVQRYRKAQSNIPDDKRERVRLKQAAADFVAEEGIVPPLSMEELIEHSAAVVARTGVDPVYQDFVAVLMNNASWHDTIARVPYERRLLLVPKCLRVEEHCPAPFDEFGLLCKECGLCSIQDLTVEAERLGYAVLVAEGSAIVRSLIETGKIDAIVGVSCLNVLEACFPHMEAAAIPGVSIPLLQDDCINTTVDLDWVWDLIHLTSDDRSYRLDLDGLRAQVRGWFEPAELDRLMGERQGDPTEAIGREWLARDGKRWRPFLAVCAALAEAGESLGEEPVLDDELRKLAVAVECFHKASLVHDDIEDDDELRYDEATLHVEHGMPVALNVGDHLIGEGFRLLSELDVSPAVGVALLRAASNGLVTLSRGQGSELSWARDPQPLKSLEVLEIFSRKTAPAFEVSLRLGALYAGASEGTLEVLREYSEALGIAYQIRDDLEDHDGESDSHDLRDLRPGLLLAIALRRAHEDEVELVEALWRREAEYGPNAAELRRIFAERGVTEKAEELLEAYKEQAVRSLRFLGNPTLKGLLRRVVGKIFGEQLIEGYCGEFEARNAAGGEAGAPAAG